jgi:hypothetical protein
VSDLLGSLVDRVLERGPVLHRRQPALFEPVQQSAIVRAPDESLREEHAFAENETAPKHVEPKPVQQSNLPTATPSLRWDEVAPQQEMRRARSEHSASDAPPPRFESAARQEIRTMAAPLVQPEIRVAPRDVDPSRGANERDDGKHTKVSPVEARRIDTIVEKRIERQVTTEHVTVERRFEQTIVPLLNESASQQNGSERREVSSKEPPNAKSISRTPPQTPALKPMPRRAVVPQRLPTPAARPLAPEPPRTVSPSPPAIHVTIGRVEVRATHQSSGRPPAPRFTGPQLSLEAYLRSRGEGN